MRSNSLRRNPAAPEPGRPVQDEWGLFDPQQAGLPALVRTLNNERPAFGATTSTESIAPDTDGTAHCPFCTETLPPGARQCPLCLRDINGGGIGQPHATPMAGVHPVARAQNGAVYTLVARAMPRMCPGDCHDSGASRAPHAGVVHIDAAAEGVRPHLSRVRADTRGRVVRSHLVLGETEGACDGSANGLRRAPGVGHR